MPDVIFSRYSLCQLKKIKYIFIFCKVLDMGGNVLTCVHASKAEIRKHEKKKRRKKKAYFAHFNPLGMSTRD